MESAFAVSLFVPTGCSSETASELPLVRDGTFLLERQYRRNSKNACTPINPNRIAMNIGSTLGYQINGL